eukprot:8759139-Pyramimonas_sp.AAC.1
MASKSDDVSLERGGCPPTVATLRSVLARHPMAREDERGVHTAAREGRATLSTGPECRYGGGAAPLL